MHDLWMTALYCDRVIAHAEARFVPGTSLVNYGDGDWDDTLQPADPAMRTRMVSAWTVALAYQSIHQLATVAIRAHDTDSTARFENALSRALALFDLTATDERWRGAPRREILRAREEFCRLFFDPDVPPASAQGLSRYFLAFAVAARTASDRTRAPQGAAADGARSVGSD